MTVADVLLDACCLINVCSTGHFPAILSAVPNRWRVCTAVAKEALATYELVAGVPTRREMDLEPWFQKGLLLRCEPESVIEQDAYVSYAARVDDGEAMCLALARCRSWTLATDERKGRLIAGADGIPTLNSIELLKVWAETARVDVDVVKEAIQNVTVLGRYRPRADAPEVQWWRRHGGAVSP